METAALTSMFERVISPGDSLSVPLLEVRIRDCQRLENLLAAVRSAALAELAELSPVAEDLYARAAVVSLGQADRVMKRNRTLGKIPALAESFAAGEVSVEHVDAFAGVYRSAKPAVRRELVARSSKLVEFGHGVPADELRRRVLAEARSCEEPGDAEERLARQKRATRLRMWMDKDGEMGRISGTLDPESWRTLHGRIVQETEARFHGLTPEHCPDDPLDRKHFLQAQALLALVAGEGLASYGGNAEVVIVHHHPDGQVEIDWSVDGLELPESSLDEILRRNARIYNVHVRAGEIVSAPGNLNVGRDDRLANRAQRRALAAVHSTCCYPGCQVRYWQTKLHHVKFWRHGGRTDLANLIPVCSVHHAKIHAENIGCEVLAGRLVRFRFSDGTIRESTGPPRIRIG